MAFSRTGLLAVSMAALVVSGCSSTRFSNMDSAQPAPLPAAPSGTVSSSQLPPPAAPGTADPSAFPTAPNQNQQMASLPPDGTAPASAVDVTPAAVAGVWNVNMSGQSCKVATPQTKFGQGYRAGPLRCPAPVDGVKSWNVSGKQLTLYDQDGGTLARLYSSGSSRFDGQTSNGQAISLSR
ncbi:protease inhibitor Inh/omp19 family protein [Mesorhizobium sp. SP-1A]|uniref:protease inhibitor Inh/omp19 family protein n=1 Tax=Mesorhizobium sp. SP-1A TaxID=3077840 RepID=UPI0028F6F9DA|nr:protease inhibitor Inh/omp19 family protein [Mesorhizobium sp. SP-1A]